MADDFSEKLNSILSNPELMKTISSMAGNFNMQPSSQNSESAFADDTQKLAGIAGALNSDDDNRIRLLNALRPYMNPTRSANMDAAIKILKLTKLTTLL